MFLVILYVVSIETTIYPIYLFFYTNKPPDF